MRGTSGIQPVSARAKYLNQANQAYVNSEPQPSGSVLSHFRDINFGVVNSGRDNLNGGARQLNSAPPTDNNVLMTKLPSLKSSSGKKNEFGRKS